MTTITAIKVMRTGGLVRVEESKCMAISCVLGMKPARRSQSMARRRKLTGGSMSWDENRMFTVACRVRNAGTLTGRCAFVKKENQVKHAQSAIR
jgi:hypothetical protein